MDEIFEVIMVALFVIAMLTELIRSLNNSGYGNMRGRLVPATFGAGFFVGAITKYRTGGGYLAMALYGCGFVISCVVFILVFKKKDASR